MANTESKDDIDDFGGLVTTLTPRLLELGDATEAEYCELNDGILEAALGRSELFAGVTVTGVVTTIIFWRKLDGSALTIVCTTSDIYKVNYGAGTFTSILPGGGYAITGVRAWSWTYCTLADKIVMTNGDDAPIEWNGTAANMSLFTLPGGVTKPKFVLWWKNRMHLFNLLDGGNNTPYRHWWSELGIYNAWTTANGAGSLDYSGGGEPIDGVADLENSVLLLKQNRATVIAFTGLSSIPFASRDLENIRGTYAPFSIQVASVGVFYLAVDGLRLFDGVESKLVSAHVDAFSNIPITSLTKATSVLDGVFKRYLLAIPSVVGGNNDTVWNVLYQFYPADRMEFSKRSYASGSEVRALGKAIRSEDYTWQSFPAGGAGSTWQEQVIAWNDPKTSGEFEEMLAGGYSGQVWLYEDQANDLGSAVPMRWASGVLPTDSGRALVRLLALAIGGVQAVNTTAVLEVVDAESDAVVYSKTLDFSTKRTVMVYPNRAFYYGFRLRFRNTAVGSIPAFDRVRYVALVETRSR